MDYNASQYVNADQSFQTYFSVVYIIMAAGGLMSLVGFLGCCGAYQESRCMLSTVRFHSFITIYYSLGTYSLTHFVMSFRLGR